MASIGAVFLPIHSVVTILCNKVLNFMIQGPLPKRSFFSQPVAGLTNRGAVRDSRAGTPLQMLISEFVYIYLPIALTPKVCVRFDVCTIS